MKYVDQSRNEIARSRRRWQVQLDAGSLLLLHGSLHRVLAVIEDGLLIVDAHSHRIHLVQRPDGGIGLPDREHVTHLFASGAARSPDEVDRDLARMDAEIRGLDADAVPNGTKSIWLWLRANWTPDHVAAFGRHDDAASIRRWRTQSTKWRKRACGSADPRAPP